MKIFLSGAGGIGLSAYGAHMLRQGHQLWGSDRADSAIVRDLIAQGAVITLKQDGSAMPEELDLFVYSEAIPEDAPERKKAKDMGVRQISYFAALGEMTKGENLICICGTHGKSSTTSMAALAFIDAAQDPNVVVGTKVPQMDGQNWRRGAGDLWIVEACEYRRSFHYLSPKIVLLTNADGDHFDAFTGADDYEQAFVDFVSKLPQDGFIVAHGNDERSMRIVKRAKKTFIDADTEGLPELSVPGKHMQHNAQLVVALAKHLKLSDQKVKESLKKYSGSWRRMEMKGINKDGVTIVDDYAHHPAEIRATLQAMREKFPKQRIVCVFQPHTHDRTLKLWNDFTTCFSDADEIIVTSIYDARPDKDSEKADPSGLADDIAEKSGKSVQYAGALADAEKLLRSGILKSGDILVILGAGDITKLADIMMK